MIKAKKHFGQNFLKSDYIKQKIIESIPNDGNQTIEIGAGLGDLTGKLIEKQDVIAYEIDNDLCVLLKSKFKRAIDDGTLRLNCQDVLDAWDEKLYDGAYNLIANLPYYIATKLILLALKDSACKNILVMVQKEVAIKFSAKPKDKEFSSLAVLASSCGEARLLFDVPKEAFDPVPKVTSAILSIKKERSLDDEQFEEFLKVAFSSPRKMLIKNLSQMFDKKALEHLFHQFDIETKIRPHELETSSYHLIYSELKKGDIYGREATRTTKERSNTNQPTK